MENKTLFVELKKGNYQWWQPIEIEVKPAIEVMDTQEMIADKLFIILKKQYKSKNKQGIYK